jgi:chorismate synthase
MGKASRAGDAVPDELMAEIARAVKKVMKGKEDEVGVGVFLFPQKGKGARDAVVMSNADVERMLEVMRGFVRLKKRGRLPQPKATWP